MPGSECHSGQEGWQRGGVVSAAWSGWASHRLVNKYAYGISYTRCNYVLAILDDPICHRCDSVYATLFSKPVLAVFVPSNSCHTAWHWHPGVPIQWF